jgi:hypothetical protein
MVARGVERDCPLRVVLQARNSMMAANKAVRARNRIDDSSLLKLARESLGVGAHPKGPSLFAGRSFSLLSMLLRSDFSGDDSHAHG